MKIDNKMEKEPGEQVGHRQGRSPTAGARLAVENLTFLSVPTSVVTKLEH